MRALKGTRGITASLVAARSSGIAPLYVHFDATGTVSPQTARPFHEVRYTWDFGETTGPGIANWGKGAQLTSRNTDEGPIAGHVFETAGTYTVTLTCRDGVNTKTATTTITVTAADAATEFLTTNTVCVSTSGNFTGAPAGSTNVTTSDLATALANLTGSVKRILFRTGTSPRRSTSALSRVHRSSVHSVEALRRSGVAPRASRPRSRTTCSRPATRSLARRATCGSWTSRLTASLSS